MKNHEFKLLGDKTGKQKLMGHKRDWKQYNKQLVNRGKLHFWISPKALKNWQADKRKKNGRPFVYSDQLIQMLSYLRFKFQLSLRETEGFFGSFVEAIRLRLRVPSYTQICRRLKTLVLPNELLEKRNVTDIVLDTTGLKVFGEGEWRAEKYGGKKRWQKLHLAMDLKTGKLLLAEITDEHVHDTAYLEKALGRANRRKGKVLFDGIADSLRCYQISGKHNKDLYRNNLKNRFLAASAWLQISGPHSCLAIRQWSLVPDPKFVPPPCQIPDSSSCFGILTPPKKGAIVRKEKELRLRNDAVRIIRGFGNDRIAKSLWGKFSGYNRRVEIESMMSRWKRLHGEDLRSRCAKRQKNEVRLKAMMINAIIQAQAA